METSLTCLQCLPTNREGRKSLSFFKLRWLCQKIVQRLPCRYLLVNNIVVTWCAGFDTILFQRASREANPLRPLPPDEPR